MVRQYQDRKDPQFILLSRVPPTGCPLRTAQSPVSSTFPSPKQSGTSPLHRRAIVRESFSRRRLPRSSRTLRRNPAVRALDALTGETRWEYRYRSWNAGGLLSTKGGLVFGGLGHLFLALDASTGRELWRVDTGGVIRAAPVSYSINGKQYVTIAAGHDLMTFAE